MIKKQHDIILIDNALDEPLANEVHRHLGSTEFPWFLLRDVDDEPSNTRQVFDKNTVNTIMLGHGVFDYERKGLPWESESVWSLMDLIMKTCIERAVLKDLYNISEWSPSLLPIIEYTDKDGHRYEPFKIQPIRIKCNMLMNNSKIKSKEQHNTPHTDNRYVNSYAGIYYVNDSDGDTIIYNEKWSLDQKERPKKLTEKMRIKPKKNRFVMFDGLYYHTSTNPIEKEARVVVNMNFLNGLEAHKYAKINNG